MITGDPVNNPNWWVKQGWDRCALTPHCENYDLCNGHAIVFRHILYQNTLRAMCPQHVPIKEAIKLPDGWEALYWSYCAFLEERCKDGCRGRGALVVKETTTGSLVEVCPIDCISDNGWIINITEEVLERAFEVIVREDYADLEKTIVFEMDEEETITTSPDEKTKDKSTETPNYKYVFKYWTRCGTSFQDCGLEFGGLCDRYMCKVHVKGQPLNEQYICGLEVAPNEIENLLPVPEYLTRAPTAGYKPLPPKPKVMFFQREVAP